jgi:hypothetical protein
MCADHPRGRIAHHDENREPRRAARVGAVRTQVVARDEQRRDHERHDDKGHKPAEDALCNRPRRRRHPCGTRPRTEDEHRHRTAAIRRRLDVQLILRMIGQRSFPRRARVGEVARRPLRRHRRERRELESRRVEQRLPPRRRSGSWIRLELRRNGLEFDHPSERVDDEVRHARNRHRRIVIRHLRVLPLRHQESWTRAVPEDKRRRTARLQDVPSPRPLIGCRRPAHKRLGDGEAGGGIGDGIRVAKRRKNLLCAINENGRRLVEGNASGDRDVRRQRREEDDACDNEPHRCQTAS